MSRKRTTCDHPPMATFIAFQGKQGARVWRCSVCGTEDVWRDSWGYYGSLECLVCGWAGMQAVFCSDACADAWKPSDAKIALAIADDKKRRSAARCGSIAEILPVERG